MIRQICNIMPMDVTTVMSRQLLAKLELKDLYHILRGVAGLDMWSILVVQSEQHVIYRLMEGVGQESPRLCGRI